MDKAVKAVIWGTVIIGSGYGLMKFTVPNETQMREVMVGEWGMHGKACQLNILFFFSV
jgi:hypothetical protein